MRGGITEGVAEEAALDYFRALGYHTVPGPAISPDGSAEERTAYDQVVLTGRLREYAARINPTIGAAVIDQAVTRLLRAESQNVLAENERVHRLLVEGVPVEHRSADGTDRTALVWLVDWAHPAANDWLVVNQFTVVQAAKNRRPDVVTSGICTTRRHARRSRPARRTRTTRSRSSSFATCG